MRRPKLSTRFHATSNAACSTSAASGRTEIAFDREHQAASKRIAFLDALRIFAFSSVLIGHKYAGTLERIVQDGSIHASARWLAQVLLPFVLGGGCGVVVFFLVSGYIIPFVLQAESTRDFIIKRVFRIYPMYIVAVLMSVSLQYYESGVRPDGWTALWQLSLFGDFSHTPPSLGGVEWTLRVEILFYLFMALCKVLGFIGGALDRFMPFVLAGAFVAISWATPFPGKWTWHYAYLNLYSPFLLVGVLFFLMEKGYLGWSHVALATMAVLARYWILIGRYQPNWLEAHFALLGCALFAGFWLARKMLLLSAGMLVLSNMTYSVYLYHNWLYDFLVRKWSSVVMNGVAQHLFSLLALLAFCLFMSSTLERAGIRLGNRLCRALRAQRAAA